MSLMHGLVEVRDRYHAYLVPLLMPIAAVALAATVGRLQTDERPKARRAPKDRLVRRA